MRMPADSVTSLADSATSFVGLETSLVDSAKEAVAAWTADFEAQATDYSVTSSHSLGFELEMACLDFVTSGAEMRAWGYSGA